MLGTEQQSQNDTSRFKLNWSSPTDRRLYWATVGITVLAMLLALGLGLTTPANNWFSVITQFAVSGLVLAFTISSPPRSWSNELWNRGALLCASLIIITGLFSGEFFNIMLAPLLMGVAQRWNDQALVIKFGLGAVVLTALELIIFGFFKIERSSVQTTNAATSLTAFAALTASLLAFMGRYQSEVKEYREEAENKASEMEVAHEIQTSLMPPSMFTSGSWTLAARSLPARDVGGDFYEYVQHPHQEHAISGVAIGDVAGKGIPAALQMAVVRTLFRVEARRRIFPGETLMSVNMALQAERSFGMVTMLYAFLDTTTNTLHISNAGHNYPLFLNGTLEEIKMPGLPLGIDDGIEYEEKVIKITPGTSVIFYTDGVPEAMNMEGELYTFERFKAAIQVNKTLEPVAMVDKILAEIAEFTKGAPQSDDITVVVLQYHPQESDVTEGPNEELTIETVTAASKSKAGEPDDDDDGFNWI